MNTFTNSRLSSNKDRRQKIVNAIKMNCYSLPFKRKQLLRHEINHENIDFFVTVGKLDRGKHLQWLVSVYREHLY